MSKYPTGCRLRQTHTFTSSNNSSSKNTESRNGLKNNTKKSSINPALFKMAKQGATLFDFVEAEMNKLYSIPKN